MSVLSVKASSIAAATITQGRVWSMTPAADCWVSIGATGDAKAGDVRNALFKAGLTYRCWSLTSDDVLSGVSSDAKADAAPVSLTYLDAGPSTIVDQAVGQAKAG